MRDDLTRFLDSIPDETRNHLTCIAAIGRVIEYEWCDPHEGPPGRLSKHLSRLPALKELWVANNTDTPGKEKPAIIGFEAAIQKGQLYWPNFFVTKEIEEAMAREPQLSIRMPLLRNGRFIYSGPTNYERGVGR
jgi:hypothetical protein